MISRFLPVMAFLLLGVLLAVGLTISETKTHIPSPLIGRPVPQFVLPQLFEPENMMSEKDLMGEPYLVNFWGSWCPTCVFEHPVITELAQSGQLKIVGLNYRDEPDDAMQWLLRHGNPYHEILVDYDGKISINFGVYAAPESFLISPDGEVVFKHIGALTPEIISDTILPMVNRMKGSSS
jgi:cytochrome c biogenesis protein CcmG/thiol:disulfide interchange protein DsbE